MGKPSPMFYSPNSTWFANSDPDMFSNPTYYTTFNYIYMDI